MLEIYLDLHSARTVSFDARGRSHKSLSRDEILGAGAKAARLHPLGHFMILADDGDEHAIKELAKWAETLLPELCSDVVAAALGRPTTGQLNHMIRNHHPRYDRARRKAAILTAGAIHADKSGKPEEAERQRKSAAHILAVADAQCKAEILSSGKCPRCRGTGVMMRDKVTPCPACGGSGSVVPQLGFVLRKYGAEVSNRFTHMVDELQMAKSDWLQAFSAQISREKEAV